MRSKTKTPERALRALARLYNVQSAYQGIFGRITRSSEQGLFQVLRALGAPLERPEDVPDAARERRQSLYRRLIDPVVVAWDEKVKDLTVRLPARLAEEAVRYEVDLENGERRSGSCQFKASAAARGQEIEGNLYVTRRLHLPERLPFGYHRLRLQTQQQAAETLVISAPLRAYAPPAREGKAWGIFLPLYALQSQKSWGAGDFSDLEQLLQWTGALGGEVVGTLPLLAAFLDEPFDPSPYAPASRLFWNEFYLDVKRIPEFARCSAAQALVGSEEFPSEIEALRHAPLVDYQRQMRLKRRVLEELCRYLFREASERARAFRRFADSRPQAEDYVRFRAATERQEKPWREWPEGQRDGALNPGDYDEAAMRYHLYAQWAAEEQIQSIAALPVKGAAKLYLDFPLGVNRDGYDVWREREAFAVAASGGAPPDNFFTKGQNWGFPPLHPERLRDTGYRYYIASLRHHLRYASRLRIDHVMGFHRLYWIPSGLEASDGVYVHYRSEEFYAILSLESHRHQALIVGENLGTVPPYVNAAMAEHGIHGMYIGQFGVRPEPDHALEEVPQGRVASLNTHDTPTFAAYWEGRDIEDRLELDLLDQAAAEKERRLRCLQREALIGFLGSRGWLGNRAPQAETVLKAWLLHLASGPAELVLVNLEDLWLETQPQNVPGTWNDRPNWRRKARYPLESFSQMGDVVELLRAVDHERKRAR